MSQCDAHYDTLNTCIVEIEKMYDVHANKVKHELALQEAKTALQASTAQLQDLDKEKIQLDRARERVIAKDHVYSNVSGLLGYYKKLRKLFNVTFKAHIALLEVHSSLATNKAENPDALSTRLNDMIHNHGLMQGEIMT